MRYHLMRLQPQTTPTQLSILAAALPLGGSVLLGDTWTGTDIPSAGDFNWNNKFHYDPVRQLAYMATKFQGVDTAMTHAFYDEAENEWQSVNCGFNRSGHVYDCIAYDHVDGTGYLVPGGGRGEFMYGTTWTPGTTLGTPSPSAKDANTEISSIMYSSNADFISAEGAMDMHPNLFGTGQRGMVIVCQRGIGAWRKSTDTYSVILGSGTFTGPDVPACVYSRGLNACIISLNLLSNRCYRVDSSSSISQIDNTPIIFGPDRDTPNTAAVVDDPNEGTTVYALEKIPSGRVWKLVASNWVLQSFTHPFAGDVDSEDFMVCAAYGHGVIWGIERTTGHGRSRLWKPNS